MPSPEINIYFYILYAIYFGPYFHIVFFIFVMTSLSFRITDESDKFTFFVLAFYVLVVISEFI